MDQSVKSLIYFGGAAVILLIGWRVLASGRSVPFARKVVCIGDSITAHGGYVSELKRLLGSGNEVRKYGYPGEGVKYISGKLPSAMMKGATDVVIQAGVNDLASGRSDTVIKSYLGSMVDYAHSHGARAVLIEVLPWGNHWKGRGLIPETYEINRWMNYDSLADKVVSGDRLGNFEGDLLSQYDSGDHLHLNKVGQKKLGKLVYEGGF